MTFPRKYPPELVDAVVQRVADTRRAVKAYGAVQNVAQQMGLNPRVVQRWVTKANTPPPPPPQPAADAGNTYLPAGLLHCGFCHHPMNQADLPDTGRAYLYCQPDCRPRPLDATAVADTIGRAILRHATKIVPARGTPTPPHLAATHAHRVLTHITVGATPTDISLTWRASPLSESGVEAERARRIATAHDVSLSDPPRARQLLHDSLTGVDPTTAPADPVHAEAATLLAELQLRLGHPTDAVAWATYAHHSTVHLHGPTHPGGLHTLHVLASAHRRAGHHQRAYDLYRELADQLTHTDGPHAHRTLATHATTALVLHALGYCQDARILLADTIATHRREHPGHPATARMTQHLTRIWHDCASRGHHHHQDT